MQMRQPSRAKVNLYTCANRMGIAVESVGVRRRVPALDILSCMFPKTFSFYVFSTFLSMLSVSFFLCYQ